VNVVEAQLHSDSPWDVFLLRHGFTDYMRDYEVVVSFAGRDLHRYQFVGCVEAVCQTAVRPGAFAASLSDEFVYSGPDYPDKDDPEGFIWGARYSNASIAYVQSSPRAAQWSASLGLPMHEVNIKSEAFDISLIFAELRREYLGDEPEASVGKQYPIAADGRPT
jgi:hypothetical protein